MLYKPLEQGFLNFLSRPLTLIFIIRAFSWMLVEIKTIGQRLKKKQRSKIKKKNKGRRLKEIKGHRLKTRRKRSIPVQIRLTL